MHGDDPSPAPLRHVSCDPDVMEDVASRTEHRVDGDLRDLADSKCSEKAQHEDQQIADRQIADVRDDLEELLPVLRPQDNG